MNSVFSGPPREEHPLINLTPGGIHVVNFISSYILNFKALLSNSVCATNSGFLIPISLHTDVVYL